MEYSTCVASGEIRRQQLWPLGVSCRSFVPSAFAANSVSSPYWPPALAKTIVPCNSPGTIVLVADAIGAGADAEVWTAG
jgi:hypothetical protein